MIATAAPAKTWQIAARLDKFHAADEVEVDVVREVVTFEQSVRRHGLLRRKRTHVERHVDLVTDRVTAIREGAVPYETVEVDGNLLLNAGIARLEDLLIGAGGQAFDSTHARIGVGDDATSAVATQTDLQALSGSTHRQFKLNSTPPARTSQTITIVATFGTTEGNFTAGWQEWGIDPGTADGTTVVAPLLNRKVTSLGTKTSAAAWQFTVTLTIS